MRGQSRTWVWFAGVVILAWTVFFLEYVIFFKDDSAQTNAHLQQDFSFSHSQESTTPLDLTAAGGDGYGGNSGSGGGGGDGNRDGDGSVDGDDDGGGFGDDEPVVGSAPRADIPVVGSAPRVSEADQSLEKLAVVVPSHNGDLQKALDSLARWPVTCHASTLQHADLVLYYAGGEEDGVAASIPDLEQTGGRCFASTRLVLADLTKEENMYPKGPSVQFYKMFLDDGVRGQFADYDALAVIEWDVIVAHETSFDKLYAAAFGGVEPFWVKGSTLDGVNFHETVVLPDSRHVLGHINGNAIYNNTDPAFVDFVEFTLTRWDYSMSYDVALWATIADFPYSWPLWQRYARKFVATDLIANVGFLNVDDRTIGKAVASNTLFIHGSLSGGGGSMFSAHAAIDTSPALRLVGRSDDPEADGCEPACGSLDARPSTSGTSTVCDRSCYGGGENGARFGGFMCGAGDEGRYGRHCRICYVDVDEARQAEEKIRSELSLTGVDGSGHRGLRGEDSDKEAGIGVKHVVMCDTMLPPPALECTDKCARKVDTVCDPSCGEGRYGDYNCNWRGHGSKCRFCFTDRVAALAANEVAQRRGGSVIMCHTYEPPTEVDDWLVPAVVDDTPAVAAVKAVKAAVDMTADDSAAEHDDTESSPDDGDNAVSRETQEDAVVLPHEKPYTQDIKRGQLCAFMIGYRAFVSETRVMVKSIEQFMPGMRIAVATELEDVALHERALGSVPGLTVSEAETPIALSPLLADKYCGEGTRLILYMNPGELLSRTFSEKDTHSVKGDLLVLYAEVGRVGKASLDRSMATTSVLGFSSPSFSFGMDIMLPASVNQELRDVLLSDHDANKAFGQAKLTEDVKAIRTIGGFHGVFVPEVLAALAYSRNLPGVWFMNPPQWVTHHMFQPASIWDIPLVKPRFGCAFDISLGPHGYDVAAELDRRLAFFVSGGGCERGFIALNKGALKPKPSIEFGPPTTKAMPTLDALSVSVVVLAEGDVDPDLLDVSLTSIASKFPDAEEVLVVFADVPVRRRRKRLNNVIDSNTANSPFPLKVITVGGGEDGGSSTEASADSPSGAGDGAWSVLRADEYCNGEFLMHMRAGDVLMMEMTYDNIFHFGKPVLPYARLQEEAEVGQGGMMEECTAQAMTSAVGKPVRHDFALLRSLAYPRRAYTALRRFVDHEHEVDIETLIANGRSSCQGGGGEAGAGSLRARTAPTIPQALYEVSLLGSFLWHHMHDTVHWTALDPLDIQGDEWETDMNKYDLWCDVGLYEVPVDGVAADAFLRLASRVDSRESCGAFHNQMTAL